MDPLRPFQAVEAGLELDLEANQQSIGRPQHNLFGGNRADGLGREEQKQRHPVPLHLSGSIAERLPNPGLAIEPGMTGSVAASCPAISSTSTTMSTRPMARVWTSTTSQRPASSPFDRHASRQPRRSRSRAI